MISIAKTLGTVSALTLLALSNANATTLNATAVGGSESLLTITNGTNESITQDLGKQIAQLIAPDAIALTQDVVSFITAAGGLANVKFAVIAGQATNGTSTATYLHSSNNAGMTNLSNGIRGTWFSTVTSFITALNTSDPAAGNIDYGPFTAGAGGNYFLGQGRDDWGTAGTCQGNDNVCNLVGGNEEAILRLVNFGTNALQFANVQPLLAAQGGARAYLDLANSNLVITAVPVPAAVWLFGSAIGLLTVARRRMAV